MRKIEYSQIVRKKLIALKESLVMQYGETTAKKTMSDLMKIIRRLELFGESGVSIANLYEVETEYFFIFAKHNYFVYRLEDERIIIVNMFHEKEDFMKKLFGIPGRTQESIDYWNE